MKTKDALALGTIVLLTAAASAAGGSVTNRSSNKFWYRLLRKPPQTPPDWVFGVVWPVLYSMIAYSGYRAWQKRSTPEGKTALALWGAQLGFNAAWSPLFFGAHKARAALVDLGLTIITVAAYIGRIRRVDKVAAWTMAPYLGWLTFASTLNGGIIRRNPKLLSG